MKHHFASRWVLSAALGLMLAMPAPLLAQTVSVPPYANFQGRLARPDGTPVPDGTYAITYRLYTAQAAGTKLWEQTLGAQTVRNGTFAAKLDYSANYTSSNTQATVFNGNALWLEIQVGSDAPLTRQLLVSNPFAFLANTVPDGSITGAKIAAGTITIDKIASNTALQILGAAGGDLTGTYPNPLLNTDPRLIKKVSGNALSLDMGATAAEQTRVDYQTTQEASQEFVAPQSGVLTSLTLNIGRVGSIGSNVMLKIYAGSIPAGNIVPAGSPLPNGMVLLNDNSVPSGVTNVPFSFPNGGVAVQANQTYTLYVGRNSSLRVGYAESNPYTSGASNLGGFYDLTFAAAFVPSSPSTLLTLNGALNVTGTATIAGNATFSGDGTFSGKVSMGQFQMAANAGAGKLLTSDTTGNGTWQTLNIPTTLPPNGAAGGDLTGTYPNPTIASNAVAAAKLASDASSLLKVSGGTMISNGSKIGIGVSPSFGHLSIGDDDTGGLSPHLLLQGVTTPAKQLILEYRTDQNKAIITSIWQGVDYQPLAVNARSMSINTMGANTPDLDLSNATNNVNLLLRSGGGTKGINLGVDSFGGSNRFYIAHFNPNVGFVDRLMINELGRVGIGTNSPNYPLDVQGDINARGSVRANGVALSSDARYKTHVVTLTDPLETLLGLRGVSYDWDRAKWADKNFPAGKQMGFLAQEVEKIFPELVSTDEKGDKSVNYLGVIPVAVEAIKALKHDADAKQQQIDELKARLERLERLLESK